MLMINVVAVGHVKSECVEEYKKIASELVAETKKESGCLGYDLFQDVDCETTLTFLESWESQAHLDAHMQSGHFKRIVPLLDKLKQPGNEGSATLYRLCT